jgi:hypothetical protein
MKPEREMALVTYVQGLKEGLCLYSILHREQQFFLKKEEG